MGFSFATGTINLGTGAINTDYSVTGKTPTDGSWKALILFWSGRSETTDAAGETDIQPGIGVAVSTSSYWYVTAQSDHTPTTTATDRYHSAAGCVGVLDIAGAMVGEAKLQSFNSNGFTLRITDVFPAAVEVSYILLGGTDLTNAEAGRVTLATVASVQTDYAGVTTFQPDFLLCATNVNAADPPSTTGQFRLSIGAAIAAAQYVIALNSSDAVATAVTGSYCRSGEIVAQPTSATATNTRHALVNFLSTGFRLNCVEGTGAARLFFLALKGGTYALGDFLSATNTTAYTEAHGMSVTPKGAMFLSANRAASTADAATAHMQWSVGASDGTNKTCQYVADKNGSGLADCFRAVSHDECYFNADMSGTETTTIAMNGEGHVNSFDATNINFQMTDADPAQSFIWYVAFGGAPSTFVSAAGTAAASITAAASGTDAQVYPHPVVKITQLRPYLTPPDIFDRFPSHPTQRYGDFSKAAVNIISGAGTASAAATVSGDGQAITKTAGTATGQAAVTATGVNASAAGHPVIKITQLMPTGWPGQRYGSFAGRAGGAVITSGVGSITTVATASGDAQAIWKTAGTITATASVQGDAQAIHRRVGTVAVSAGVAAAAKTLALAGGSSVAVSSAQAISKIIRTMVGSSQSQVVAAAVGSVGTGAILVQSHFRWRNDDGGL